MKFNKIQKKWQKKFAAKAKGNKADFAAVKAAAKALSSKITKRFKKEKAAKKKANKRYAQSQKRAAKALKAKRAATAEKFAKKAAKSARAFKADMREASVKKQKALTASKQEKAAKQAAKDNAKAMERETKASEKKDMEIKECALDGSECQTPDGKCHKVGPKGPFMASDFVSCSKKKPSEDEDSGLAWAGVEPPLALPPLPKPSKKCKKLQKKVSKYLTGNPSKDMVTLGCKGTKKDLMNYFDMAAACPPICKKRKQV